MKIRDIVLAGILSAATTAGKLALSFVPNVEIVTLFFIVFTTTLGIKRSLMVAMVFVTTEILDLWFLHLGYRLLPYLAYAGFNCISPQQKGQL